MTTDLNKIKENLSKVASGELSAQVLEDIVGGSYTKDEENSLVGFAISEGVLSRLHEVYGEFEKEKEVGISREISSNPNIDWKTRYPLPGKYIPIVTEEIVKLEINKDDHIAITGSGSFPATAISIADRTGAKVTCIEKIPEYAKLATDILKTLGYNNIDVVCADAAEVQYTPFTKVWVTLLTDKKEEILNRICSTSKSKILLRSANGIINLMYPKVIEDVLSGFKIAGTTKHGYIIDCS